MVQILKSGSGSLIHNTGKYEREEGLENDNAPAQTVDPGLDENEPELGVLVLPVPLQMLADGDGLLDEEVHVLG